MVIALFDARDAMHEDFGITDAAIQIEDTAALQTKESILA